MNEPGLVAAKSETVTASHKADGRIENKVSKARMGSRCVPDGSYRATLPQAQHLKGPSCRRDISVSC